MPYGKFSDDEHFNTGLQVGLGNAVLPYSNPGEGMLKYIEGRYGDKAGIVIAGIAAGLMERGMRIPAIGFVQASGIKLNKKLIRVLNSVYERSEETFLKTGSESQCQEDKFTDEFLKRIRVKPTY